MCYSDADKIYINSRRRQRIALYLRTQLVRRSGVYTSSYLRRRVFSAVSDFYGVAVNIFQLTLSLSLSFSGHEIRANWIRWNAKRETTSAARVDVGSIHTSRNWKNIGLWTAEWRRRSNRSLIGLRWFGFGRWFARLPNNTRLNQICRNKKKKLACPLTAG